MSRSHFSAGRLPVEWSPAAAFRSPRTPVRASSAWRPVMIATGKSAKTAAGSTTVSPFPTGAWPKTVPRATKLRRLVRMTVHCPRWQWWWFGWLMAGD